MLRMRLVNALVVEAGEAHGYYFGGCEEIKQANDSLCYHDPGRNPSNLVVRIVLVKVRGISVEDGAEEQAQSIKEEEYEMRCTSVS